MELVNQRFFYSDLFLAALPVPVLVPLPRVKIANSLCPVVVVVLAVSQ